MKHQSKKTEADRKTGADGARASGKPKIPAPTLSKRRKLLFRLVAVVLVPLTFFGLLEAGLRVAGYGYSTSFFKKIRIGNEEFLVDNDKFGWRFFPPELSRSPPPVRMEATKPPGTFRIFIFGGSAAFGDPQPAYSAGRYLQALLRERFPERRFEVVCVAMTAINSHAVLPIARECAKQNGDLWIIYMGNNEMVGSFGAVTIFGSQSLPVDYVRLILAVENTRVGQLLQALSRKFSHVSKYGPTWGGMQMFLKNRVAPTDPRKEVVYQNFRRNLADILQVGRDAGVPILLNTVAVNLKDCAPFASVSDTTLSSSDRSSCDDLSREGVEAQQRGQFAVASERLAAAAKLDPPSALLQYELGTSQLSETNFSAARDHLEHACDFDALPFRADSRINDTILKAARKANDPKVVLCDAAGLFETNSPQTVPGDEWFYEHVHFNFDGNYQLARAWADKALQFLSGAATNNAADRWASQADCERRLGLTDWNRSAVLVDVLRRLDQPPFVGQLNNTQQVTAYRARLREVRLRETRAAAESAREVYLTALKASPDDHRLHENFAEFLEDTGALDEAAAQWEQVRELIPHHHVAWFQEGRLLMRRGKLDAAEPLLTHALQLRPDLAEGWLQLGILHAIQGKTELALDEYERERQLEPNDSRVYYHIGEALSKLHRSAAAIENLRRSLQLQPTWETHYALGEELGFNGQADEARKEFEQVTVMKPGYALAHLNLGVALDKLGKTQDALNQFEETLRLEPGNKVAAGYVQGLRARIREGKP